MLEAFVDPGRPVVLFAPCSPLFIAAARCHRARVRWVPTRVESGRLRLDFDRLSRAMRGAALAAVAEPGNPVGTPLADDDADRLRWTAERSDVLLFVDETYRRFRANPGVPRLAELAPDRTLVAGSLTATGHAALRVGWLSGPPSLVRACGLMQSATAAEVPAVCQHLASRALTTGTSDREAEAVRATCRDAAGRLREMGFGVADPADGCFLWADVSHTGHTGRSFAEGLLAAEDVRVGPGDRHGPGGEAFVRLCGAADPGRLREGLNRIARFVGSPRRPLPAAKPTPVQRPAFSRG